jgi:endonuclease/exonuclease/phosphatase family metal-dependent hydrolase
VLVGTFNLWSGRAMDGSSPDGAADPALLRRSVAQLADLGLDVLTVQEVDRAQPRSGGLDQLAEVAAAFGAVDARFAPTLAGVPGPGRDWAPFTGSVDAAPPDGPSYGIGLVSRLPVLAWRLRRLGASRAVLPVPIPSGGRLPKVLLVPDEPRVALAAVVQSDAGPVTVISAHLSFAPVTAVRQLRLIRRWAASLPGPRVLAGDLNLPAGMPARVTGWRPLASALTFPAPAPRVQLDHLLTDLAGGADRPASEPDGAIRLPISDHQALVGRMT